jgi:hypothetical protein
MIYNTTLKNTRMTDVVTAIGSAGKLEIGTAAMATVLATILLSNPAGTVSGGVLTFSGTPLTVASAANSGTAAAARVRDGSNTDIITGLTVSSSSGDIVLSSTNIVAGQPVTITSASITHG